MHILSAFSVVQFNEAGNFIHNMKEWASNAQIDEVFTNPLFSGNDQMYILNSTSLQGFIHDSVFGPVFSDSQQLQSNFWAHAQ